jgi:hypothetical protein
MYSNVNGSGSNSGHVGAGDTRLRQLQGHSWHAAWQGQTAQAHRGAGAQAATTSAELLASKIATEGHVGAGNARLRGAEAQRRRGAEAQKRRTQSCRGERHKGADAQRHRGAEAQRRRDTEAQRLRGLEA